MEATTLRDRVRAAETDIANGRPDRALAHCQALLAQFPRAIGVQRLLGEVSLAMNRPEDALRAMERVLASDPDDARACCARAIAHQMLGDRATALNWYRRACEIRPEDNMLRQAYRELATPLGQETYRQSSAALARLYLRGDQYLHAEHEWQSVLAHEPDRLDALLGLAETFWRMGDDARAGNAARRALNQSPACLKALLILAAVEHASSHDAEALQLLRQAAELDPERRVGRTLYAETIDAGDSTLEAMLLTPDAGASGTRLDSGMLPAFGASQASSGAFTPPWTVAGSPHSGSLPMATQEDLAAVSSLANSRSSDLPPDFHSIFAETEFMLWGRESDDVPPTPIIAPPAPVPDSIPLLGAELPIDDQLENTRQSPPPPAFGRSDSEDTESRAAVGWVQWLQALGARPLDQISDPVRGTPISNEPPEHSRPSGSLADVFSSFEPPVPFASNTADATPGGNSAPFAGMFSGVQSGGLGDPGPGGEAQAPWERSPADRTADTPAWDVGNRGSPTDHDAADPDSWRVPPPFAAGEANGAPRTEVVTHPQSAASRSWESPDDSPDMASRAEPAGAPEPREAPVTLESLEGQFAASGFERFEPKPGDLASFSQASATGFADPLDHVRALAKQSDTGRAAAPREILAEGAESPASQWSPGAPVVSGSGLERARELRAQGNVADALAEYASVLRESPELASTVSDDLRAIVAQSNDPAAYRLLGDAFIHAGNYEQALDAYNQAQARTQPNDA